ncbi:MAG: hypothetical protein M0P95_16055 [Sulfuritalea sp.]|nr:hypothetical protein [Sulfuritalea sp.]
MRRDYPYTGKSDGFTARLRRRFAAGDYIGIALVGGQGWRRLAIVIESPLQALDCAGFDPRQNATLPKRLGFH